MPEIKNKQKIVGVMSGTSLDGLDIAICEFETVGNKHNYAILKAITIPYSDVWRARLTDVKDATAEQYFMLNGLYGNFVAEQIKEFREQEIVNFKEALIFAFLGYLRLNNKINTLKFVTGASSDSIGGAVYLK